MFQGAAITARELKAIKKKGPQKNFTTKKEKNKGAIWQ